MAQKQRQGRPRAKSVGPAKSPKSSSRAKTVPPAPTSAWGRSLAYLRAHPLESATWLLAFLGLIDSIYLTFEHLTANATLACSDRGVVNCAQVTTSAQSRLVGIPVAYLGLAFFVVMIVINSPWGWRRPERAVHLGRLTFVSIGMIMVLWLLYAELIVIRAICLYCTGVHIITFLMFCLIVTGAAMRGTRPLTDG